MPSGSNKLIRVLPASLKMIIDCYSSTAKERNYLLPPKNSA